MRLTLAAISRQLVLLHRATLWTCLFVLALPLSAAEPAFRASVASIGQGELTTVTTLGMEWSYRPGDNMAWADPGLDDKDWALVRPSLRDPENLPGGWPGIGWFRRHLRTTEAWRDASLGFHVVQAGASEVYFDGRLVARFGTVSTSPEQERPMVPQYIASTVLEPGVEHVIAVRYSNVTGNVLDENFNGFELSLGEVQYLTGLGLERVRQFTALQSSAAGLFGALALLHLLLFFLGTRSRENLYFALFTSSVVALSLFETSINSASDLSRALYFLKWMTTASVAVGLSMLLLELRIFGRRIGWPFVAAVVAGCCLLLWVWSRSAFPDLLPISVFMGLVFIEASRLAVAAVLDRRPESWVIGIGFLVSASAMLLGLTRRFLAVDIPWQVAPVVGLGALALCFSIYLSRQVVRTNRELEANLHEVETLTKKTLEQERRALREDGERRLLEAENRRRRKELEEARDLQLAMLPRSLPELPGIDLAVHMSTANEVGGDYYDFRLDGEGRYTFALGDATGHGLHAGMVVGVAKSLFQSCDSSAGLADGLRRIGLGLESMHRRLVSMTMVLLQIDGWRITLASAAMPPVLVWRQGKRAVEELLSATTPLGARLGGKAIEERVCVLEEGDTLLVMSDGLVEATDPRGEPLGYDLAASLFASAAKAEAAQLIVDELVGAAQVHLGGTPLDDDMTLLVLRATA